MKFKLKSIGIVTLFILSYIIYIIALALLGLPNPVYKSSPQYVKYNNELKPIDAVISDSVSYRRYREMTDSIKTIRDIKNGDYFATSSQFLSLLGAGRSIECDTCSLKWFENTYSWHKNDKPLNELYYIQLPSWKLNIKSDRDRAWTRDSIQFYVEHNQAYVRKFVTYLPVKANDRQLYQMVDIPVKFRYDMRSQCVMIPVSKSVKQILDIVLIVLAILFFGYILILIGDFIGLLMDLAKGLAFTNKNLRTLKRITFTLFAIPFVELILNLLLRLFFKSYFTSDVVLNIATLDGYWKLLTVGIIFLMIYRAFRQGKKLKDDQEFTV